MLVDPEPAFLARLRGPPVPAFILGDLTSHSLGFIRSLGRRGIPTVAIATKRAPKSRSRYCLRYYTIADESERLAFLTQTGGLMAQKAALLPTGDPDVLFMSRNRDVLSKHYHFILPSADVLERLANKKSQYEYVEKVGFALPQTFCLETEQDLARLAKSIRYPCVVKPAYSHIWRDRRSDTDDWRWLKAVQIDTPEQLRSVYEKISHYGLELLVQERIEGPDTRLYSLYIYFNRNSEPLAWCVIQKRRQWPPLYGTGSFSITCRRDEVVALGLKLLKDIGYQGIANAEFKHDARDGVFKLIEANVRGGERIALAVAAGVDIPYIAYRDIIGDAILPTREYKTGVTWVNLIQDLAAFSLYYRRIEASSWWRWICMSLTAQSHAFFAWDDPVPVLGHLAQALTGGAQMVYGRLRNRFGNHQ